ncbi:helix-turn-helix transcriptional regulator [Aquimarina sp. M1]
MIVLQEPQEITHFFYNLNDQLQGKLSQNFGEYVIKVNNALVTGTVRGMKIQEHKIFLEFDLRCHEEFSLELTDSNLNPVHFLYSQKDQSLVSFTGVTNQYSLEEFQTAIIYNKFKNSQLHFHKNSHVKICVISVCAPENINIASPLVLNIHSLFTNNLAEGAFVYFGSYNLKIDTQISKLNEVTEEGVIKKLFIEGMVQLILAMEIQHHQDDINSNIPVFDSLSKNELKIIKDLCKQIKDQADVQYSIEALTLQTGISAAKLQTGFKHLYGRTVTDFIKNTRLEIAENLIKTTDLNISEVVYSVGFSSRSYFSKIFREKYGCSPKVFQDNVKYRAVCA